MHLPPAVLVLGTIVSLPLLLIGGYVWQAGLDLHSPSSVRGWIELCARGREDVFCKAAQRVVRDVQGPVVLIYPGVTGDHDLLASLTRWKGRVPTAGELEALVRANLFEAATLQTGQMRSLDGQLRQVIRILFVSPTIRNFTGLPAPRPEPVLLPLASARIERALQPIQSESV